MHTILILGTFIFSTVFAAHADTQGLEKTCGNQSSPFAARIEACQKLSELAAYPKKAWAKYEIGRANRKIEKFAEAIAYYTQAITLEPNYKAAYKARAYAYAVLKDYPKAIDDIQVAIDLDAKDSWSHYFFGTLLYKQKKYTQAIDKLNESLRLDPKFASAFAERGFSKYQLKRYDSAVEDFTKALLIRPLYLSARYGRARAYDKSNKFKKAAGEYKFIQLIKRNNAMARFRLDQIVNSRLEKKIELPDYTYQAPAKGLQVEYLQTLLPKEKELSDIEKSMQGLIDWFRPAPKVDPEIYGLFRRSIENTKNDTVTVNLKKLASINLKEKIPTQANYFKTFLPVGFKLGNRGPEIKMSFSESDLQKIFPLRIGNQTTGKGLFRLVCPAFDIPPLRAIGCEPGKLAPIGEFAYNFFVEKAEQVHVPAGVFNAFVIRYREKATLRLLGKEKKRTVEVKWWFVPELNWWVRRTNLQGDKMAIIEAVNIVAEDAVTE